MGVRHADGSAGDADYGRIGAGYGTYRRADPRIAALIVSHFGAARHVLNVGAGAGSYEPTDREDTDVEPSATMRAQRPAHLSPAVDAVAERLPFADDTFDAALATFTIHRWSDLKAGHGEMRRVTRGPILLLSCEPGEVERFWLADYAPGVVAAEARRYPPHPAIAAALASPVDDLPVPIPFDCSDGFNEAYYGRPELLLDPGACSACSSWSLVNGTQIDAAVARLGDDLASGAWDRRFGHRRLQPFYLGSLRLNIATAKT